MSIFVRPTSSTKPKKLKKSQLSRILPELKGKTWIIIGTVIGILLILLGIGDWLLVRSETYRMQIIEVSYPKPVPYTQLADDDIVSQLTDKHYYLTRYSSTLSKLVAAHPPVASLELQPSKQTNIYTLLISYRPVNMMLRFQGISYGLVEEQLYTINTSTT